MTLRTVVFWLHLVAAVCAGAVILLMSVTGVLLTYERQLIAWSDRGFRSTPPAEGAAALPVESLLARLRDGQPGLEATGLTFASRPDAPVTVSVERDTFYADAYTGRVLGQPTQGMRQLMSRLRSWHRWLAVEGDGRPLARAVTGWSNAVFLFVVASGFYLWFPRRWSWQHVRPILLFGGRLRGKARDFNWHNVIGFWSAVPLFLVVLTAMPISFPWANALVYRLAGEAPPAGGRGGGRGGGPAGAPAAEASPHGPAHEGLDRLLDTAGREVPGWRTLTLQLPDAAEAPVVFAVDRGDGGQPHLRSTLTLDRATGAVVSHDTFADQGPGRRLRSISRFAHTGEVLGLPGQTIAGLVTAGAVVLVWTGIALTLRRFRAWLGRQDRAVGSEDSRQASAA
jgi:uncharacterized iron-regulated membrane protein